MDPGRGRVSEIFICSRGCCLCTVEIETLSPCLPQCGLEVTFLHPPCREQHRQVIRPQHLPPTLYITPFCVAVGPSQAKIPKSSDLSLPHPPPSRSTSSPHHLSLFTLAIHRYPTNVDALLRIDRLFRDRHTWLHSLANRYLSERRNNPQVSLEKRSSRRNNTMAAQTLMSILSLAVTPTVISSTL